MINPFLYFWIFLKASLFSSGGTGNLPSLHNDLIPARLATETQFAEGFVRGLSLAIVGISVVIMARLLNGTEGIDYRSLLLVLAAIGAGSFRKIPVFAIIAVAGVVGIVLYRN
jgi:chromate transporter